jgi:hypothetical protein
MIDIISTFTMASISFLTYNRYVSFIITILSVSFMLRKAFSLFMALIRK